jgi:peptide deformylase
VTIRPIREVGDPVLRTPADEVKDFDRELAGLVRDLLETVDHPGRAGLAAPQIGVGLRAFSYNIDGVIGHVVNPTIAELSEEIQDGDEGCLSVPGIWAPTVRAMHAVVEGFDVHGEPLRLEGEGLMARCLQHEVDHLDGRVFLDRLKGEPRKQAFRMLRERTTALP